MTTLVDKAILSGADNRPPMLEKDMYDSWKRRMEQYMMNKQHGRMILESVKNGSLIWPTIEENGVTRPRKYFELTHADAIQADCDVKTTNIILQGLPPEVYALEKECKLYDEFDKFAYKKGETLRDFYLRFSLLLNDMNVHTRSFSNLVGNSSSNPTTTNLKRRNRRRSKQSFSLEESPVVTMADQRTMAELLRAPTEGYAMQSSRWQSLGKKNSRCVDDNQKQIQVNQQTSAVTTCHGRAILKQFQKHPPASVKAEEDERVKETLTDPEHGGFTIKLPEKLGDPGKFLIPCGFSELKCKALADLGIARDVFVPVGKFTFPAENEEIVFNPGIITSKRVHSSLLPELSHRAKVYKSLEIHESPMEIFSCS
ncbi:hypothetical protein Tco_0364418 [Tanacetum coccineum]